jgi:hypothetical protein
VKAYLIWVGLMLGFIIYAVWNPFGPVVTSEASFERAYFASIGYWWAFFVFGRKKT